MSGHEIRFTLVRSHPGQAQRGPRAQAGRAVLRLEGLRQHGDASRAQGAAARERVLALLPRSRARVQPLLQLFLRHERRRRLEVPEGRGHRPSPDLEDGHRRSPGRRRRFRPAGAAGSVQHVPRVAGGASWRPKAERVEPQRARCATPSARRCTNSAWRRAPTRVEIKARFKVLVKRHHPDANGGDRGMRRQAARDHPGLQLSEVSRRAV